MPEADVQELLLNISDELLHAAVKTITYAPHLSRWQHQTRYNDVFRIDSRYDSSHR